MERVNAFKRRRAASPISGWKPSSGLQTKTTPCGSEKRGRSDQRRSSSARRRVYESTWPVMSPYRFSGPQCDVPRLGPGGTSNVETRGPSGVRPPEVYRRLCPQIGDVVADLPRHPARDRVAHNGGVKPPLRPRVKILWHGLPARDRSRPRWPCHAWVAALTALYAGRRTRCPGPNQNSR